MDHAKTFRNSLILNVLSDNSIANSTDKDEGNYSTIADDGGDVTYVEDNESDIAVKRDEDSNSSTLSNNESQPNRSNLLKKRNTNHKYDYITIFKCISKYTSREIKKC